MVQSRQTAEGSTSQAVSPKRSYQKPKLFHFGSLREITLAVGTQGAFDGGNPPDQKTSAN